MLIKRFSFKHWMREWEEGYRNYRTYSENHLILRFGLNNKSTVPNIEIRYESGRGTCL